MIAVPLDDGQWINGATYSKRTSRKLSIPILKIGRTGEAMHKTREISHARRALIQERKRQRQFEKWTHHQTVIAETHPEGAPSCDHIHLDKITENSYGCHDCGAPFLAEPDND